MTALGRPLGALACAALWVGGCASVDRSPGFPDVQTMAADRGIAPIRWNQDTEADKASNEAVQRLLADDLSVDEAVQVALLNNRQLQATYESLRIAQADVVEAGLLKNPVFDGSVRFVEAGGGDILDLGVAFDFLDVFFIPMRKAVAEAEFERAKLDVTGAVIDLAGQTRVACYELQAAEQMLEMRQTSLAAYEASYDLAKRIRAAGNNTRLRVANEQAVYEEARLAVIAAEADVATLREQLNELMGLYGTATRYTLRGRLPDPPDTLADEADLESTAVRRSLDLQASQAAINVAAKRLGIARPMGILSDLEVGATAEREEGEWSVGPSLSMPIPIFSQGQPAVAKADAELRQALHQHHHQAVRVRATVRAAYARVSAAHVTVQNYKHTILPLRQFIVDESQKQYNAMLVGAFELLQAKRDQVDAGRQFIEAQRDYWIARSQLEQILSGRLVEPAPRSSGTRTDTPPQSRTAGGH